MATAAADVQILSKSTIRPSPRPNEEDGGRVIHLTPWDLKLLSFDYIQKGILFRRPPNPQQEEDLARGEDPIISDLRTSFAATLDHFFPLAGRLAVAKHDTSPPSLSISLRCNDEGAEFIHASAPTVKVSDVLDSLHVPPVVQSFFPLNGVLSYDGHCVPLLAIQVTELADGLFIGCSLNHSVADGTCFWSFFNAWSEICRTGRNHVRNPPALDRWFVDSCKPPLPLPFSSERDFIRRLPYTPVEECMFHFSAEAVARVKARANAEMGADNKQISSLQSLLAHLWLSVTRARRLDPEQETSYVLVVGCRTRLTPPLPQTYLGNSVYSFKATATAGELLRNGLGWAAWLLNEGVGSYKESTVRSLLEEWPRRPSFTYIENKPWDLMTGSSPRFNVYGNDFGWGRPVAVRSGRGNKCDGKATVYPGPEKGSIAVEVCLSPEALSSLVNDEEFMEMVSSHA